MQVEKHFRRRAAGKVYWSLALVQAVTTAEQRLVFVMSYSKAGWHTSCTPSVTQRRGLVEEGVHSKGQVKLLDVQGLKCLQSGTGVAGPALPGFPALGWPALGNFTIPIFLDVFTSTFSSLCMRKECVGSL